jgi:hypothetical protein
MIMNSEQTGIGDETTIACFEAQLRLMRVEYLNKNKKYTKK